MRYLKKLMALCLEIILVGCAHHPNFSNSPTITIHQNIPRSETTVPTITPSPTGVLFTQSAPNIDRPSSPSPTIENRSQLYPQPLATQTNQLYPEPQATLIGQSYPPPITAPNNSSYPPPLTSASVQPYPSPIIMGGTKTPNAAQTSPSWQASPTNLQTNGTVQVGTSSPTFMYVDVALRATDPTTVQLASGGYQLIEFFAFWCPTCKSLSPVLHFLENKYASKIRFVYLDIDDRRTVSFKQSLGYQYQPHIFLIDGNGQIMKQWIGGISQEELESSLSSIQ